MTVTVFIPGEPQGKERPKFARAGAHVKTYTPEKTVVYESRVRFEYIRHCKVRFPEDAVLEVDITAVFSIPKRTPKKNLAGMLDGSVRPTRKPDVDNIVKIILDALNGVVYKDDAKVVAVTARKIYGKDENVGVIVKIRSVNDEYKK